MGTPIRRIIGPQQQAWQRVLLGAVEFDALAPEQQATLDALDKPTRRALFNAWDGPNGWQFGAHIDRLHDLPAAQLKMALHGVTTGYSGPDNAVPNVTPGIGDFPITMSYGPAGELTMIVHNSAYRWVKVHGFNAAGEAPDGLRVEWRHGTGPGAITDVEFDTSDMAVLAEQIVEKLSVPLVMGGAGSNVMGNQALGSWAGYAALPLSNDAMVLDLIQGTLADGTWRDDDTFGAAVTSGATVCTATDYVRKTVTPTLAVVDASDTKTLDYPDTTWTALGGATNNTIVALAHCYDDDTTGGTNANLIVVSKHDLDFTTDDSDVTITISNAVSGT